MIDRQTAEWLSHARTPQTRARIRQWSRRDDLSVVILLVGFVAFVVAIPVGIGLGIWFWIDGIDRFEVFYWLYGSSLGVLLVGVALNAVTTYRLTEARFADGRCTIGVIEDVIRLPSNDVDANPTYALAVRAAPPEQAALSRTIHWGSGDSSGPDDSWIGRAIRFRHNTFDPDAQQDALFGGWPDDTERS
ncbi:hypothetical protein [Gordonia liuliyuniae]|uniref:Uncharacterized protein n=1 Tax=Gordonia liuliyuniae TaxID=2911517 RepID=A0ABS9INM8_9ACTN|nr:hypothetical protein [Gordonia liuliyuniae]MCF8587159.1 hypothetical protein [Gordonia liuliyuniae]